MTRMATGAWARLFGRRSGDATPCFALAALDEADLSEFGRRLRREAIYEMRDRERQVRVRRQQGERTRVS